MNINIDFSFDPTMSVDIQTKAHALIRIVQATETAQCFQFGRLFSAAALKAATELLGGIATVTWFAWEEKTSELQVGILIEDPEEPGASEHTSFFVNEVGRVSSFSGIDLRPLQVVLNQPYKD